MRQGSGLVDMSWIGFKSGIKWKIFDQFSVKIHGEYRSKKSGGLKKNTVIAGQIWNILFKIY